MRIIVLYLNRVEYGNLHLMVRAEYEREIAMKTSELLSSNTYTQAMAWEQAGESVRIGQKIRVTFQGLTTKSGYAYREEGSWLGIRYTWKSMRWWSLLNYNNPLVKLEVQELTGEGRPYWITLWEREVA